MENLEVQESANIAIFWEPCLWSAGVFVFTIIFAILEKMSITLTKVIS